MSQYVIVGWRCPTPCDEECEAPCHEAHVVPYKRDGSHFHTPIYGWNSSS